jgi:hypothetical protein
VTDATVLRLPHAATERLIEQNLGLARHLRDEILKSFEAARQSAVRTTPSRFIASSPVGQTITGLGALDDKN